MAKLFLELGQLLWRKACGLKHFTQPSCKFQEIETLPGSDQFIFPGNRPRIDRYQSLLFNDVHEACLDHPYNLMVRGLKHVSWHFG